MLPRGDALEEFTLDSRKDYSNLNHPFVVFSTQSATSSAGNGRPPFQDASVSWRLALLSKDPPHPET